MVQQKLFGSTHHNGAKSVTVTKLDVEAEVHYVAFFDDVFFAFQA